MTYIKLAQYRNVMRYDVLTLRRLRGKDGKQREKDIPAIPPLEHFVLLCVLSGELCNRSY